MVVKNHMVKRNYFIVLLLVLVQPHADFWSKPTGTLSKIYHQATVSRSPWQSHDAKVLVTVLSNGASYLVPWLKPWTMWDDNILLGGWIMPNHVFESLVDEYRNFGNPSFSNNITRVLMLLRWIWLGMLFQHVIMAIKGLACDPWSDSSSIQNKLLQNRSLAMAWTIFSLIRWHFLPHLLDSLAASSRPPLPSMLFTLYTQRVHYWIFWRYFRANIFKFQIHHTINMHIYN